MTSHDPQDDATTASRGSGAPFEVPSDAELAAWRARMEAGQWFDRVEALVPRPRLGPASAIVNALVFLAVTTAAVGVSPFDFDAWRAHAMNPAVGDLIRWGANFSPLTLHGEPWRLVAAAFLHAGVIHLLVNAWGLCQMGWVERTLGRLGFVVVYFASAIAGNLASLLRSDAAASVGASGALCGLIGAIFGTVLVPTRSGVPRLISGRLLRSLLTVIAINAFLGATMPAIDNRAHAGGFLAGLVLALAIVRPPTPEAAAGRARRALVAAGVAAAVLAAAFFAIPRRASYERADGHLVPDRGVPASTAGIAR